MDLVVEDEHVIEAIPQIGFVHRGLEKLVETRDIHQFIYVAERICGICSFGHSLGYAETVESLMGVEVPRRAQYLRAILHELSRVHSHLLWLGLAADAFGFESLFMHCWRLRERVLDIFEATTGGRVILSYVQIGGVVRDIDADTLRWIRDKLDSIEGEYKEICATFLKDSSVRSRLDGVGYLSQQQASELCMVGPFARASNVPYDCRVLGHGAYGELSDFTPITSTGGDCLARVEVRCAEVNQSIAIVKELGRQDSQRRHRREEQAQACGRRPGVQRARAASRRMLLLRAGQRHSELGTHAHAHAHHAESCRHGESARRVRFGRCS